MCGQIVRPTIYNLPAMRWADNLVEHAQQVREMADFSYLAEPTGWLAEVLLNHAQLIEDHLREEYGVSR